MHRQILAVLLLLSAALTSCGNGVDLTEWCEQVNIARLASQRISGLEPGDAGYEEALRQGNLAGERIREMDAPREIDDIFPEGLLAPEFPIPGSPEHREAQERWRRFTDFVLDRCELDADLARELTESLEG